MGRRFFTSIMADGASEGRLTAEQEEAYAIWSQPPYWDFLTGTWPLKANATKTRPAVPIYWTLDPDEKRKRPMPSVGYEYARDAILEPVFCWKPAASHDRLRIGVKKSRKVLGTLWLLAGAGAEVVFQDAVAWDLVKGSKEEATSLIVERLRIAYNHENYPEWLRRYRPVRPSPVAKFARYKPGSPRGVYESILQAVGANFGTAQGKGHTTDYLIDEAPEVEGLRPSLEAIGPGCRRIVMIGTPPEPSGKGKRQDPDSVAVFCECVGLASRATTPARPSHQRRDVPDAAEMAEDDYDMIGAH